MRDQEEHGGASCTCGQPHLWAADPHHPVVFVELVQEYQLRHGPTGRLHSPLRYCPWCGGHLPSVRSSHFTTPSETEIASVQELLSKVRSVADAHQVLGPPDVTHEWEDEPDLPDAPAQWVRALRYSRKWETLDLVLLELPDGTVSYCLPGKYIGPRPDQP